MREEAHTEGLKAFYVIVLMSQGSPHVNLFRRQIAAVNYVVT